MPHLLKPINTASSLDSVYTMVHEAQQYLTRHAKASISQINHDAASDNEWGIQLKRVQVNFSESTRPLLIDPQLRTHTLSEIMNQSATIARLLDALIWAKQNLSDYHVVCCHPATSSDKANEIDNDLVLQNHAGQLARFEVSDVMGEKDSNGKEKKDLASLGVLDKKTNKASERWLTNRNSSERLFLVVSPELARGLRKRKNTLYQYLEHATGQSTFIFEILHRQ